MTDLLTTSRHEYRFADDELLNNYGRVVARLERAGVTGKYHYCVILDAYGEEITVESIHKNDIEDSKLGSWIVTRYEARAAEVQA